jgi:hypothetical protein
MAIRCKAHKARCPIRTCTTPLIPSSPPQLPDMVDVVSRKCRFASSLRRSSYPLALTLPRFEGLHGPCYSQASYGFPGVGGKRGTAVRCRVHREPSMVNVVSQSFVSLMLRSTPLHVSKSCQDPGCSAMPIYGNPNANGGCKPVRCAAHKLDGMIMMPPTKYPPPLPDLLLPCLFHENVSGASASATKVKTANWKKKTTTKFPYLCATACVWPCLQ